MKPSFLSATETATGSRYLVARMLVECGLIRGPKKLR